jgi:hypothetical protein
LEHLAKIETFKNLACIVSLLSVVKNLIKLAQSKDVFVNNLVGAKKLTHA